MTYDDFTIVSREIILNAQQIAKKSGHIEVDIVHILLSLFKNEETLMINLIPNKLEREALQNYLFEQLPIKKKMGKDKQYLSAVVNTSFKLAKTMRELLELKLINGTLILYGITKADHKVANVLRTYGITPLTCIREVKYD